ncbi:MAG: SDR family oxidoreductase [Bacteroidia bacterium]
MSDSKNILIAGATSGIGLELTKKLLGEGHKVFSISRRPDHPLPGVFHVQHDFSGDAEIPMHWPERLHGLVYCPGTIQLKPFGRLTDNDFLNEYRVNVLGAVQLIRKAIPALKHDEGASVVLFSSVAARTGMPFHASIAAAKGSIESLTFSLAAEYAPQIRFNCIAPSLTDTPLAGKLLNTPEKISAAAQRHPLKKTGSPEEMAEMAAFLLHDAMFITGAVIPVDGGIGRLKL